MRTRLILLVEDDDAEAARVRAHLESRGEFFVDVVRTADAALKWLTAMLPDAVLLDTTLPDIPAREFCHTLRSRTRTRPVPCVMLGDGRRGLGVVDGLSYGADEYVIKPLDLDELEARLKAVLRRQAPTSIEVGLPAFRGRHIEVNFADVLVCVDGHKITLTRRELLLLRALVEQRNRTLSRNELSTAWGADARDCRVVDSAMWKLRRKLRSAGSQIETIVGFGYRFNEPSAQEGAES